MPIVNGSHMIQFWSFRNIIVCLAFFNVEFFSSFTLPFFITGYVQIFGDMLSFEIKLFYVTCDKLEEKFCLFSTGHMEASCNF